MALPLDLAGERFGRLVVLRTAGRTEQYGGCTVWRCRCDCGTETDVPQVKLIRGYDACDACRSHPCVICGGPVKLNRNLDTCSAECLIEKRRRKAHESYLRNADQVKQRSLDRQKRRRAEGDPVYREIDKRKYARIKADPEKYAAARAKAREAYARNSERIAQKRAANRPPKEPRECGHCGQEYTPRNRNSRFCSERCARAEWAAKPPQRKLCVICGAEFLTTRRRLTCSQECRDLRAAMNAASRNKANFESRLDDFAEQIAEREAAALACQHCGKKFSASKRRRSRSTKRPPRYCSIGCRDLHRAAHRAASTAERPCVVCSLPFVGAKRSEKTCSIECRAEYKRRRSQARLAGEPSLGGEERTCVQCGEVFRGHGHARYCGNACIAAAKREREQSRVDRDLYQCSVCSKPLTGDLRTNRYTCSPECRREALRRKQRRAYLNRRNRDNNSKA